MAAANANQEENKVAKHEPENKSNAAKPEAAKPKATKPYKVLASVLFGHRIVTVGSIVRLTETEAATLLARGVVEADTEGK
jgi:hypothetical protein